MTNRKLQTRFRLVSKSTVLDDLADIFAGEEASKRQWGSRKIKNVDFHGLGNEANIVRYSII